MEPLDYSAKKDASPVPVSVRWGLIWAAAMAVIGLVAFVAGMDVAQPSALNTTIQQGSLFGGAIFCVFKALQFHRDRELGGFLSLGRSMGVGALTGLVAGAASAVWQMIFTQLIDPTFGDRLKVATMIEYQKNGMSEEQTEMVMESASFFFSPMGMALMSLLFLTFIGFLIGLFLGLVLKKERPYMN